MVLINPAYEIDDKITLGFIRQCPNRLPRIDLEKYCNTGKNIAACSIEYANFEWRITWDVPLCYERNRTTGSFQAVALRITGEKKYRKVYLCSLIFCTQLAHAHVTVVFQLTYSAIVRDRRHIKLSM